MSPDELTRALVREVPTLRADEPVGEAVRAIVNARVPALPVENEDGTLYGLFGEREFIAALFPGYFGELRSASFVPHSIDDVIDQRLESRDRPVSVFANRERVAAGPDPSDAQLAETFLHHRVLIVPIVDAEDRVRGIVTRSDFFRALAARLAERD